MANSKGTMKKYKHKKTGKLYSLIQDPLKIKMRYLIGDKWEDYFVLYKAEYDNPDGPYFVRDKEDFYNNFEEVQDEENNIC